MIVYIFLLFLIIIIAFDDKYIRTCGVEYIGALMIALATFRGLSVGSDTAAYYDAFINLPLNPSQDRHYAGLQIVWYYFCFVFKELLNFRWLLFSCSAMLIIPSFWVFKKNSPYPVLSCLIFLIGFFYISSLNVMRQFVAIGIVFLAYYYYDREKYISSFILILTSACFHTSSLIVLIIFITKLFKINKSRLVLSTLVLTFIIGFFYINLLKENIVNWSLGEADTLGYNQYFLYFGFERNFLGNLVKNLIFVLTYLMTSDKNNFYLKLYFISIILNNLFGAAGHASRIILYFSISMCIAIPSALACVHNRNIKFWNTIIIIFCLSTTYCLNLYNNNSEVCPYYIDL